MFIGQGMVKVYSIWSTELNSKWGYAGVEKTGHPTHTNLWIVRITKKWENDNCAWATTPTKLNMRVNRRPIIEMPSVEGFHRFSSPHFQTHLIGATSCHTLLRAAVASWADAPQIEWHRPPGCWSRAFETIGWHPGCVKNGEKLAQQFGKANKMAIFGGKIVLEQRYEIMKIGKFWCTNSYWYQPSTPG